VKDENNSDAGSGRSSFGIGVGVCCFHSQEIARFWRKGPPNSFELGSLSFLQLFRSRSIRRGYEVYKNVCANCHSLNAISFRHLINVCFSDLDVKTIAESTDIEDGPNDEGEMYKRPGKITDRLPPPYANDEMARYINNGALPPDLTLIIKARENGPDYVYSLLTGFREPPAGITLREGTHFNPYFIGGVLGMAPPLQNGLVEYSDGTPSTISQMAKDVTTFLSWTAEPEHDERKNMGVKAIAVLFVGLVPMIYFKRIGWAHLKTKMNRFFH